jgi:hypothetical protein
MHEVEYEYTILVFERAKTKRAANVVGSAIIVGRQKLLENFLLFFSHQ